MADIRVNSILEAREDDFTEEVSAGATKFVLSCEPADNTLRILRNGVEQREGSDYTRVGLTVTPLFKLRPGRTVLIAKYMERIG